MPALRTHHAGVTVADLDRAVEFYRDAFGFELLTRFTVDGDGFSTAVDVSDATGTFAHLDADGARLELVEYDPEGSAREAGDVNRPGTTHLGFAVDDVDAFYDDLPDDVETVSAPQTTSSGTRIVFLRDPEGTLVEVLQA